MKQLEELSWILQRPENYTIVYWLVYIDHILVVPITTIHLGDIYMNDSALHLLVTFGLAYDIRYFGISVLATKGIKNQFWFLLSSDLPEDWPRLVASWSLSPCSLSPCPLSLELTMSASWNAELQIQTAQYWGEIENQIFFCHPMDTVGAAINGCIPTVCDWYKHSPQQYYTHRTAGYGTRMAKIRHSHNILATIHSN